MHENDLKRRNDLFSGGSEEITVRHAGERDFEELAALYKSVIGRAFCVWDEFYPTDDIVLHDIKGGNMFVLESENGEIDGAFAIDCDEELVKLSCWKEKDESYGEISRLVVRPSVQNRGIGEKLLRFGIDELCRRGFRNVRFLVAVDNVPAVKAYNKIGFDNVGMVNLFDIDFYCYEKNINSEGGADE